MLELDSVSWGSIKRYAENGFGKEILQFFQQMLQTFINPEHTMFISVFVHEGRWYLNSLSQDYNLKTWIEHYACKINLLGWAGLLNDAEDYNNNMMYEPNVGI